MKLPKISSILNKSNIELTDVLKNKKILIVMGLVLVLVFLIIIFFNLSSKNIDTDKNPEMIVSEIVEKDEFARDLSGNIKKVLIVDNDSYFLQMDVLGKWEEYLLPIDKRDQYDAFLVPGRNSETNPYFYIKIEPSEAQSQKIVEEEIIYKLKDDFDTFELEQISYIDNKYIVNYKTSRNRQDVKNYEVIVFKDGYKISFTYSALAIAFVGEKGYIDDMINSYEFSVK